MIFGLLILMQLVTGLMVGFRHELDRALHPSAFLVAMSEGRADLQTIATRARLAAPGAKLTRLDIPVRADEAYLARAEGARGVVLTTLDPGSAQVLRSAPLWRWPVELAFQMHAVLLAGETGERVIGFTGLALLVLAVTGPVVWWPGLVRVVRALRVRRSLGVEPLTRDLHRSAGVFASAVLTVAAFTGVAMAWKPWIAPGLSRVAPMEQAEAPKPKGRCSRPQSLDAAVAAARGVEPGATLKSLRFPGKGVVAAYFRPVRPFNRRATDRVWVDLCSATVLRRTAAADLAPGDRLYAWMLPLHSGEALGLPGRLLVWAAALVGVGLSLSGVWLWLAQTLRLRTARRATT